MYMCHLRCRLFYLLTDAPECRLIMNYGPYIPTVEKRDRRTNSSKECIAQRKVDLLAGFKYSIDASKSLTPYEGVHLPCITLKRLAQPQFRTNVLHCLRQPDRPR